MGAEPFSRQDLVAALMQAVREAGYAGAVHYLEPEGKVALDSGRDISVEQLYAQLKEVSAQRRREGLAKAAQMLLQELRPPDTWTEAKERIYPALKRMISVAGENIARQLGVGPPATPVAKLTPHIVIELGILFPLGTMSVTAELLTLWEITPEAAFAKAGENLAQRSGGVWGYGKDAQRVRVSPWRDSMDACRLLLPGTLASLEFKGPPVVVAPTPSLLLAADSEDEEGLFQLGLLAKRIIDANHMAHLVRPLRLCADKLSWEHWLPPTTSAARAPLRFLEAIDEVRDYAEHIEMVARAAKGRPTMPLPALTIIQSALTGDVRTITAWAEGKVTALPRADTVLLVREGVVLGACEWANLAQAPGIGLRALPDYPTRYLATDFPEDWQMGALDLKPWEGPIPT